MYAKYAVRDMGEGIRCAWYRDDGYSPEEVGDKQDAIDRGELVVLGCIVERNTYCPYQELWRDVSERWAIIIEPDHEKLDEYARENMSFEWP